MEGQDRCPSTRSKRIWKLLHKLIEHFKFLVYIDPERLENTLTGLLDCLLFLLFWKEIQCFFNDFTEFRGRIDPVSTADLIRDRFCQLLAVRFVSIFVQHARQLLTLDRVKALGGADAFFLIQAQIQRSIYLERKASLRIVNLHRRHAQIG